MRPFEHIDSFDIRDYSRHRGPAIFLATRFYGGSATTEANPATLTTSGSASPLVSGSGSSATEGSIAVGAGGKYQESGSIDLSSANLSQNISASTGSTINITGDSAEPVVNQLLTALANGASIPVSVSGSGGGGTTVVAPSSASWLDNINWTLIAILGAGVAVLFILFRRKP